MWVGGGRGSHYPRKRERGIERELDNMSSVFFFFFFFFSLFLLLCSHRVKEERCTPTAFCHQLMRCRHGRQTI
jgi:preprotein translocase subunit SecG